MAISAESITLDSIGGAKIDTPQNTIDVKDGQELRVRQVAVEGGVASQVESLVSETPGKTPMQKRVAHIQLAALCCTMFVIGWADGTTGPLLNRIQEVYNVSSDQDPSLPNLNYYSRRTSSLSP